MEVLNKETLALKVSQLIRYGIDKLELDYLDAIYAHNQLIELFSITNPNDIPEQYSGSLYKGLLNPLAEYALSEKMIDEFGVERFKTKLMGYVTPSPSQIVAKFNQKAASDGIKKAADWFYRQCMNSTYLNVPMLNKNISWSCNAPDGSLVITINCARPEKDPKEIALAKLMPQTNYPKCMLCAENLGYSGRINFPARQTLRYIPIELSDGSVWNMQFSPYRYFDQHCIMFNSKHEPMDLTERSFSRMIELVKAVPHYFVGSNAPLPIVGGSILAHDHYQGGNKVMPEFKAPIKTQYVHPDFEGVKFSIIKWHNSVIRVKAKDEKQFVKAVNYIYEKWADYDDPNCNIYSHTDGVLHNSITPVFRLERGYCYAELFLRNNRTDDEHPYGIFHPTEDMHFIKKEGIGIIEVMGTFILPGRIARIFDKIRDIVYGKVDFDLKELDNPESELHPYKQLIEKIMNEVDTSNPMNVTAAMYHFVALICEKVIKCTAVFKNDDNGEAGFEKFMATLGCTKIDYEPVYYKDVQKKKEEETEKEQQKGRVYVPTNRNKNNNQYQKKGQYNSQFGSQGQSQYNRNRQQNGYNRDNNVYRNNRGYGNNNGYRNNGYQRRNYQTPQIGDQGRLMQTTENDDAVKINRNPAFIESVAESNAQPVTENINEKVIVKNETIDVTEEPVKRKRGRPRKNQ